MSLRNYEDLLTVAYVIKVVFDGGICIFFIFTFIALSKDVLVNLISSFVFRRTDLFLGIARSL